MKIFLSYSSLDRSLAGQVKSELEKYGLEVFLAHEDIEPLAEWANTIFAELKACDIFLPILTENFDESDWTDQETGIAFAFGKLIIPLKFTNNPHGFISRIQALPMDINKIPASCDKVVKLIASKPAVGDSFRNALIIKFGSSRDWSEAASNANRICSFENYTPQQLTEIIRLAITNNQIYGSFSAKRELQRFIQYNRSNVEQELLEAFDKRYK